MCTLIHFEYASIMNSVLSSQHDTTMASLDSPRAAMVASSGFSGI